MVIFGNYSIYAGWSGYKSDCLSSDTEVATDNKSEQTRPDFIVSNGLTKVKLQSILLHLKDYSSTKLSKVISLFYRWYHNLKIKRITGHPHTEAQ